MTIIELGRTNAIEDRTAPMTPFVRRIVLGPYEPDADILSVSNDLDESDRPVINLTGVRDLEGAVYAEKASIADMSADQQSFYWDFDAQTLYLHLPSSSNPFESFFYGIAEGYSDGKVTYIDDQEFLPLIESSPGIEQEQDIENYDKPAFITGSVELRNENGRLDNLKDKPVYGNNVLMYYAPGNRDSYTDSDLTQLATLFIEDYDIAIQSVSLRVQDRRKEQNASIPQERFTAADYPNMTDSTLGKVIPVLWGTPREIPAIITNDAVDDDPNADVTYRAALTLTSLGTVSVETESEVWTTATITPVSTNLATGEFTLDSSDARDGDRPLEAKLIAPTGIAVTYISDIIKDANNRFVDASYNDSNYDTTEWEAEETSLSAGTYYVDEEMKLFEMVSDLQNGANVGFRYEIKSDGRRTIRIDDESRTVAKDIPNIVIANRDELPIATNSELLVAEVVVTYNPSYVDDDIVSRLTDDSSLSDVLETYQQRPLKEYSTILTNSTDAQERATYVLNRFDTIRGIGEFELMGADYLTLRIYDIVTIEITPDELTHKTRAYYGTWKCKVLSIAPNPRTVTNTITAVLIEEA